MSYRLTPEERRIIERTKREGEEFHASHPATPAQKREQAWRSILIWIGGIVFLVALALLVAYIGSLL